MQKVLFLDFDGPLHPSTEVLGFAESGLPLPSWVAQRPRLLRWAPLLELALDGTDCAVVVHSNWRKSLLDSEIRALLTPSGLAERLLGSTPASMGRESGIVHTIEVMGLEPPQVLILDDAREEFDLLRSRLLVCSPLLGVSDPKIQLQIRRWAR